MIDGGDDAAWEGLFDDISSECNDRKMGPDEAYLCWQMGLASCLKAREYQKRVCQDCRADLAQEVDYWKSKTETTP